MSSEKSFEDLVEQAFTVGGQALDDLNKLIYCFLRFMGNHSDAEDVTQETLLIIWQRWEADVRDRSSLKPWALQVAYHKAIDHLRRRRVALSLYAVNDPDDSPLYEFLAVICPEELPEEHLEQQEEYLEQQKVRQLIWKALEEVPDVHRSCLILRIMQSIKAKEVARLHGCSVRQIERYVKQGKEEFNAALEHHTSKLQIAERRLGR